MIGYVGFFLFLAIVGLQAAGTSAKASGNQPQPVTAPVAVSATAKSTPAPVHVSTQPMFQPIPLPVPTPSGMSADPDTPSTQALQPNLLPGLLISSTVVLILGFAIRQSRRRKNNGRSIYQRTLTEGANA